MPKRSSRDKDFVKQKQKVGKKKLAPTNATSTAFKAWRDDVRKTMTVSGDKGKNFIASRLAGKLLQARFDGRRFGDGRSAW